MIKGLGLALLLASVAIPAGAAELVNGVAAGDVTATTATLWARANTTGALGFELSTANDFANPVFSGSFGVADTTAPVLHTVGGLAAGTRYFYRATDAGGNQSLGSFTTAAAAGTRAGLHFGVSGDWRGDIAPYPSIKNVAAKNLDFFVNLGDTIYGDVPSPAFPQPQATSLADYRTKHIEQLTPRNGLNTLVDLRQSTALIAQIDDHEVTNDFSGAAPISSDARFAGGGAPTDLINTSTLYKNGVQAFQDYQPIENRTYAGTGDSRVDGRPDLYRTNVYGSDAVVLTVDARSFRDTPINDSNPAQTLAAAFTPGRTLLGSPQLARVKADLLAAKADGVTWKFINLPEPIQNFGPLAAADRYEGYAAERSELLAFIADNHIQNVVFITADIHGTSINNLTYQTVNPANPGLSFLGPQIASSAFEISTGAGAYDAPFGPTLAFLAFQAGFINAQQYAFYNSLPIAADTDSFLNDKDDFIKAILNGQLNATPQGFNHYSPLGLEDSGLRYELLSGDWFMGHTAGWTEFEIAPRSQALTVRTWGIPIDLVLGALGNDAALASLQPQVIGEFRVFAAGVPEPGSWALLIAGFGVTGVALRRRRAIGVRA